MTARCRLCGKYWIISICKQIPRTGYVCPYCETREHLIQKGILKKEGIKNEVA